MPEEKNNFHLPIDFKKLTEVDAGEILSDIYGKALDGIPKVSRSVEEMVNDYACKADTPKDAALMLVQNQVLKCGTSGFLTGLGGLITLPVAIPANIGSVLYVQLRMVAGIAKLGGYDIKSDQVQTMVYLALTGSALKDVVKQIGIKFGEKTLQAAIKKIPGKALVAINQRIGYRLITKFGEKGIINLGKAIPLIGGVVGGGIDVISTKIIAKNAIDMFINNVMPEGSELSNEEIADIDSIDITDESELI